jgi:hypothetical protein
VALTAALQLADRPSTFFCKQANASLPPGVTPEHFDMKSLRQFERSALCCALDNCAAAGAETAITAIVAKTAPANRLIRIPMALPLSFLSVTYCPLTQHQYLPQ